MGIGVNCYYPALLDGHIYKHEELKKRLIYLHTSIGKISILSGCSQGQNVWLQVTFVSIKLIQRGVATKQGEITTLLH